MLGNRSIFICLWKSPGIDRFHPTHRRNLQASCYQQELKPKLSESNARWLLLFSLCLYFECWALRYYTFFPKWEPSARPMTVSSTRQWQFPPNLWPKKKKNIQCVFTFHHDMINYPRKLHFILLAKMKVIRADFDPFFFTPHSLQQVVKCGKLVLKYIFNAKNKYLLVDLLFPHRNLLLFI